MGVRKKELIFVYAHSGTGLLYAITEKQILSQLPGSVVCYAYLGEVPEGDINLYIFNGTEFEIKPKRLLDEMERTAINTAMKRILELTDWYVLRFAETGKEIPKEIKKIRADARSQIVTDEDAELERLKKLLSAAQEKLEDKNKFTEEEE